MLAFLDNYDQKNKGDLFVFEVGPSIKFVSAINDAIFNEKNGGNFFLVKNTKPGGRGGVRGGFSRSLNFLRIFFCATTPKDLYIRIVSKCASRN